MLRWMAVITERLEWGVGGWQMEKQKRGIEKIKKHRRTKSHDGRGWNKSDERKKNGL